MPLVKVTLVDGVFTEAEKHAMAADLTDVMLKYEGSEAFREVVWVMLEELHTDGWHMGGLPFRGPPTLVDHLEHSKAAFDSIDGHPVTRLELAKAAPVIARYPHAESSRSTTLGRGRPLNRLGVLVVAGADAAETMDASWIRTRRASLVSGLQVRRPRCHTGSAGR